MDPARVGRSASTLLADVNPDNPKQRQTVRNRRRAQVDRISRHAGASGFAHKTLNSAIRAVFDCRKFLAAANDNRAREAFARLIHATRQVGLWLDYEEGDE
jgi:hypothetical protein